MSIRMAFWIWIYVRNIRRWRTLMSELQTTRPNHALHLTRRERRGCHRCVPCAGSLRLGR